MAPETEFYISSGYQRRYLKLATNDLQPIADMIDSIYTYKKKEKEEIILFNA